MKTDGNWIPCSIYHFQIYNLYAQLHNTTAAAHWTTQKKKKKSLIYTTESTNLSDKVLQCTYKSNVSMTFTIYCLVTALMFSPSKDKARFNYEAILRIVFWKTTTFYRNNSANSEIQNTDLNSIPLTLQTKVTHESSVYATTSNPSRRTLSLRYSPLSF